MTHFLSNNLANAALRNTSYTGPATVYVSLYSTAPTANTAGTEITGNGYSRQSVAFDAPSEGAVDSSGNVTFSASGNAWPTVVAVGLVDASTGGNILFYENIAGRNLKPADELKIDAGELVITIG